MGDLTGLMGETESLEVGEAGLETGEGGHSSGLQRANLRNTITPPLS